MACVADFSLAVMVLQVRVRVVSYPVLVLLVRWWCSVQCWILTSESTDQYCSVCTADKQLNKSELWVVGSGAWSINLIKKMHPWIMFNYSSTSEPSDYLKVYNKTNPVTTTFYVRWHLNRSKIMILRSIINNGP